MIRFSKAAFSLILILAALCGAQPGWANPSDSYEEEAMGYVSAADEAAGEGDYAAACDYYGRAWGAFDWMHDALIDESRTRVSVNSYGSPTEDTGLKLNLQIAEKNSRLAFQHKEEACAKAKDAPRRTTYQLMEPTGPDMSREVGQLQVLINSAFADASSSSQLYQARNFPAACSKARAAAQGYVNARAAAAVILKASGSYRDVGSRDITALDANLEQSARDASEFYCQPPLAVTDFRTELSVFAAMKRGLHLERGSVTPLTGDQALTQRAACVSENVLRASRTAHSPFATALKMVCNSFVERFDMQHPNQSCETLDRGRRSLEQAEPRFRPQAQALYLNVKTLQKAFDCNGGGAGPDLLPQTAATPKVDENPNVPPGVFDIKPLPPRA